MRRPLETEYASSYAPYIRLTRGANYLQLLQDSSEELLHLFDQLTDEQANTAYAEGKWTLKELLQHIIDSDAVFAYRALCMSRQDPTPLPGFEQDDYVAQSRANTRTLESLKEDFRHLRAYLIGMYSSFDARQLDFIGSMNGHPVSALALAYIIAGHTFHHLEVIKNRYL